MKIIHVLGLGESLSTYKPDEWETIGVNDCHKVIHTDYLVCVDFPRIFSPERRKIINESNVKAFYSHLMGNNSDQLGWSHMKNFSRLYLSGIRGDLSEIDTYKTPQSCNSTFIAVCIAYKLKATRIIMHGVDLKTHPKLGNGKLLENSLRDFRNLYELLKKKNVELFVSSEISALSEFIPVYQK